MAISGLTTMFASKQDKSEEYLYVDSESALSAALARLEACTPRVIAVDTETSGLHVHKGDSLLFVQLYHPALPPLVADCRRIPHEVLKTQLQDVLTSSKWLKIFHHAYFDLRFIEKVLDLEVARVYDTMLAERTLIAGSGAEVNLRAIANKYLGQALDKSMREQFPLLGDANPSPELLQYCADDVRVLPQIMLRQVHELDAEGLLDLAHLEFELVPALVEAHLTGVLIDRERWQAHLTHLSAEGTRLAAIVQAELQPYFEQYREEQHRHKLRAYEAALSEYEGLIDEQGVVNPPARVEHAAGGRCEIDPHTGAGPGPPRRTKPRRPTAPVRSSAPINLASPAQLQGALAAMGVPLPTTRDGKPTTNHDGLATLSAEYPVAARMLEWRGVEKLVTAFGQNVLALLDESGRLHPEFKQYGADTGRMSCANPNVQQVPANELGSEFRRCFIAPPGFKLVGVDYRQIELCVLHELAGQDDTIDVINKGLDLHCVTASRLFGIPYEELVAEKNGAHKSKRQTAKTINFGVVYGLTPQGLARELGIPLSEAQGFIASYFAANPGVKRWLSETATFGLKHLYVRTPLGRKRRFERNPHDPRSERRAYERHRAGQIRAMYNHPIQGASADITKQAIVFISRALKREQIDAQFQLFVHDEIVMLAPEGEAERVASIMAREMKSAAALFLKRVEVEVDCWIASTWSH